MARQDWMQESLCKDLTPEESDRIFFIGPGQSSKRARLFCHSCPVRTQCNQYAIAYDETGIWAGNTEDDRKSLDKFIKDTLRATAEASGKLESRNLNDFIPQVRNPHQVVSDQSRQLKQQTEILTERVESLMQVAEQLEALVHPFDLPNVPEASGH